MNQQQDKRGLELLTNVTRSALGSLIYRLYVLPSSLFALWGLLFLSIAIIGVMGWGKYLIIYAFSHGIDSINFTNDDVIRFVGIASLVGTLFFEAIRLIFRRSIDYRAVERKLRLALIVICWPLANIIFSLSSDTYDKSGSAIIFIVILGISLIGLEILAGKMWGGFERFF